MKIVTEARAREYAETDDAVLAVDAAAEALLTAYLAEATAVDDSSLPGPLECYDSGRTILAADPELRMGVLQASLDWLLRRGEQARAAGARTWGDDAPVVAALLQRLYREVSAYSPADVRWFFDRLTQAELTPAVLESPWIDLMALTLDIATSAMRFGFVAETQQGFKRLRSHLERGSRLGLAPTLQHTIAQVSERLAFEATYMTAPSVAFGKAPLYPNEQAYAAARLMLELYLIEITIVLGRAHSEGLRETDFFRLGGPDAFATGRAILEARLPQRAGLIRALFDLLCELSDWRFGAHYDNTILRLGYLLMSLVEVASKLAEPDLLPLIERMTLHPDALNGYGEIVFSKVVARSLSRATPTPELRQALSALHASVSANSPHYASRQILAGIEKILAVGTEVAAIEPDDDWGHVATAALVSMELPARAPWEALLHYAATITGTKPSRKWLDGARPLIDAVGAEPFARIAAEWLRFMLLPSRNLDYRRAGGVMMPTALVSERNSDVLKGLAWCGTLIPGDEMAAAVGDAAIGCFRKIPELGARSTKAGNACVGALGAMPNLAAVAQLQRIAGRVKLPSAQKIIENALNASAKVHGLSRADLDDLAIPTFGLVDCRARTTLGSFTAELVIGDGDAAELCFLRGDGTPLRGIPAEIKRDFPDELKQLKQVHKDLRAVLPAQRARLEALFLVNREWSLAMWRDRYRDHPLLAHLVRRLIWSFDGVAGAWLGSQIIGVDDVPLDISENARVRLWHPIEASRDTVLDWREWLERHQITQPFKQSHREIYLLTDAECVTETYSNRFAAHILRQHQFQALCRERGWEYRLQGGFDGGGGMPALQLPAWGLNAEFYVESVEAGEDSMSPSGIFLFVATDQVRFTRRTEPAYRWAWHFPEPVALADVPSLVFSEVMRDVDLFTGVCSIGADPEWPNRVDGLGGQYQDYWQHFSFGELSEAARTRRDVLARLLPRLTALRDRWELDERYLNVRGDLRSYRVHLGSGNVLMEPNAQYLCIVPGAGPGSISSPPMFLPFEGDRLLSIIISKALMLANDRAITDRTITRQINAS